MDSGVGSEWTTPGTRTPATEAGRLDTYPPTATGRGHDGPPGLPDRAGIHQPGLPDPHPGPVTPHGVEFEMGPVTPGTEVAFYPSARWQRTEEPNDK